MGSGGGFREWVQGGGSGRWFRGVFRENSGWCSGRCSGVQGGVQGGVVQRGVSGGVQEGGFRGGGSEGGFRGGLGREGQEERGLWGGGVGVVVVGGCGVVVLRIRI